MTRLLVACIVTLTAVAARAQQQAPVLPMPIQVERPPAPAPGSIEVNVTQRPGKATASRLATDTVTIEAIDRQSRTLTVKRRNGRVEKVQLSPEVERLPEFAAGDVIRVDYRQDLELEVLPPGSKAVPMESGVTMGQSGRDQAPGVTAASGVQGTVTVTAIDTATRVVTLGTQDGETYQVKAGPTVHLEKLKVGDLLLATYVEAVAVNLVKVAPGKRP